MNDRRVPSRHSGLGQFRLPRSNLDQLREVLEPERREVRRHAPATSHRSVLSHHICSRRIHRAVRHDRTKSSGIWYRSSHIRDQPGLIDLAARRQAQSRQQQQPRWAHQAKRTVVLAVGTTTRIKVRRTTNVADLAMRCDPACRQPSLAETCRRGKSLGPCNPAAVLARNSGACGRRRPRRAWGR